MVVENAKKIKLGNPLDPDTDQGPLVSKEQFDRVMRYIDLGVKEGARLVTGGKRHGTKGYFVEPTVFADVTDNMTIAKEEIFGPVMSVLKFDQNEDVLKRANSSAYGLAAAVVSEDLSELNYFIDGLKAGSVYANCYHVTQTVTPFGGYKDSGLGRELGEEGLNNYL
jgi:aldehyde dehydrogenase (NAD+)